MDEKSVNTVEFIKKIMKLMEEEGLTQGQVEYVVKRLPDEIKRNNERLRRNKPFAVSDN